MHPPVHCKLTGAPWKREKLKPTDRNEISSRHGNERRALTLALAFMLVTAVTPIIEAAANPAKAKGHGGPPVPAAVPVEVVGGSVDASVQGVVEVLNDALYEPFVQKGSGALFSNEIQGALTSFDIPDGKRLIIETISLEVFLPPGQKAIVSLWLRDGTASSRHPLMPLQSQGVLHGSEWFAGSQSFKLRLDAQAGNTQEFSIGMLRSEGTGQAQVSVIVGGYLVDL